MGGGVSERAWSPVSFADSARVVLDEDFAPGRSVVLPGSVPVQLSPGTWKVEREPDVGDVLGLWELSAEAQGGTLLRFTREARVGVGGLEEERTRLWDARGVVLPDSYFIGEAAQ